MSDQSPAAHKKTDRTVVCPFLLGSKKTCRQLVVLSVIMETIAAFPLSAAWFIGTVTMGIVVFHLAFHNQTHLQGFLLR
jgi:hypothetical protein